MNCESVEPELIGYHFGTLEGDARASVEAHLVECSACVKAFVALKRAIESPEEEAPSASTRARIRRSVELELRPARVVSLRPAKRDRVLAFGIASAAMVLTVTWVQLFWTHRGQPLPGLEQRATVDQRAR